MLANIADPIECHLADRKIANPLFEIVLQNPLSNRSAAERKASQDNVFGLDSRF